MKLHRMNESFSEKGRKDILNTGNSMGKVRGLRVCDPN